MVSSDHPLATEAALWALERGGTAADAYMTAAIAQCVLEPTMTTLAGGFGLGYFEAASGTLRTAGGGFAPPRLCPSICPTTRSRPGPAGARWYRDSCAASNPRTRHSAN